MSLTALIVSLVRALRMTDWAFKIPANKNGEPSGSPKWLEMKWWVEMDSNQRKLTLADLQSAPFSHSGIYPFTIPACAGRMYGEGSKV